jgi:tRNA A37 methylthiotransferase MiaB
MKKIFLYVNGCDRRGLDANKISNYLPTNKYVIVDNIEDADIIIFFSCAVTDVITKESLKKVKQLQKYNAELIVAGCLPAIEKEKLGNIFDGKTIITKDLDNIKQFLPNDENNTNLSNDANIVFINKDINKPIRNLKKAFQRIKFLGKIYLKIKNHVLINLYGEHSFIYRYLDNPSLFHIRIATGCFGNCSYCAIKKAIGLFKSKPLYQCIEEFKDGIKKGYKHFVIDADDPGAYGLDIGSNLPELLNKLVEIPDDFTISIRNLHPRWVVKYINELEKILKKKKIICLESPIQSGCDRILKSMSRYSDIKKIKEAFLRIQNAFSDISLTTHYILGFPTETEDEFLQTMDFQKKINFCGGIIFAYAYKTGTNAEKLEPKISQKQKRKRYRLARKILKKNGYDVIYFPIYNLFIFEDSRYRNG